MPTPLTVPVYNKEGRLVRLIPLYQVHAIHADDKHPTTCTFIRLVPQDQPIRSERQFAISHAPFWAVAKQLGWPIHPAGLNTQDT